MVSGRAGRAGRAGVRAPAAQACHRASAGQLADVLRARHAELHAASPAEVSAVVRAALCAGAAAGARICQSVCAARLQQMRTAGCCSSFSTIPSACERARASPTPSSRRLRLLAAKPHAQKAQIMALGGQVECLRSRSADDAQLRAALESIQPGDGHANFGELGRDVRAMSETVRTPDRPASLQRYAAHRHAGELCRHGVAGQRAS